VLYIASGNAMNVHGLREFLSLAWSAVVEQVPDAELVVAGAVGRALPDDAPRVTRIGTVGDLGELYRGVRVVINPARAGTGAKIKTIEALSHLRPVVTFPAGVDGLPADLKALCDVVQEWDEFSGTVAGRLLDDRESAFSPSQRESIARATSPDLVYADFRSALIQRLPNGA